MTQSSTPEGVTPEFVGDPDEENPKAVSAGEESHEDPWKYADLDAPHQPPASESEED